MTHEQKVERFVADLAADMHGRELEEYLTYKLKEDYMSWGIAEFEEMYNDLYEDEQE